MPPIRLFLTTLAVVGSLASAAHAQTTLVSFTFEGTATAAIGASRATLSWNSGGAEGYVGTLFNGQGQALSIGNFQNGEYFQLTLDASGFSGITLADFRANGSASAPRDWKISYSLAGISGTFVDATTYTLASNTASNTTTIGGFDLPSGADDNSSIVLRLIATSSNRVDGGGGVANGTVRLDNFVITGTAIPEPAPTALLAGLAVLALAWRRRVAPAAKQKGPPDGGPASL